MAGADIYNLASTTEVLRSIECPICTDVPVPPIYNCENGHFLCNSCRALSVTQKCGLCSAKFTSMRNYPLEAIVRSSTFKCKHEGDGCKVRVLGDNYADHVAKCEFRPAECNHSSTKKCVKQQVSLAQFVSHLQEVHKLPLYAYPGVQGLTIKEKSEHLGKPNHNILWPLDIIQFEQAVFFVRKMLDQGVFRVWMTYFGGEDFASGFQVKILLAKPNAEDPILSWTIPVHSFRKPVDLIRSSAEHFAIPVGNLTYFCKIAANEEPQQARVHEWQMKYVITRKECS